MSTRLDDLMKGGGGGGGGGSGGGGEAKALFALFALSLPAQATRL